MARALAPQLAHFFFSFSSAGSYGFSSGAAHACRIDEGRRSKNVCFSFAMRAVAAAATSLLAVVAFYHVVDAVQAVMAQVLRGYKRATAPMVIYALALWGVGLGGGYLLALTDSLGPARGAAGFWMAAVVSLALAGAGVTGYFLWISRDAAGSVSNHQARIGGSRIQP